MIQSSRLRSAFTLTALAVIAAACPYARAAEHVTLRNGAEFDCLRQEPAGDRVRLYLIPTAPASSSAQLAPDDPGYIEVSAASVLRVETIPDPPAPPTANLLSSRSGAEGSASPATARPTPADIRQMLNRAGALHNIDADLLASIVHAESDGNPRAVSRAGAQGLMQLMPSTATHARRPQLLRARRKHLRWHRLSRSAPHSLRSQ